MYLHMFLHNNNNNHNNNNRREPAGVQLVDALQEIFPLLFACQSIGNQKNILNHFLNCKKLNGPLEQKFVDIYLYKSICLIFI